MFQIGDNKIMPNVFIEGQVIEVNATDYYLYWHGFVQMLVYMAGLFSYFPNTNRNREREFEENISFLRTNLEKFDDAELREQSIAIIELLKSLPLPHRSMVNEVTTQLKIINPQSPYEKRLLTRKWRKLIAGQAPTEEMKQALKTLQIYSAWYFNQIQEIARNVELFQKRIEKLYPEVIDRLGNA
jgi:hypothetical protein